ncbi:MAG: NrfD/PsrC family molybdoenzyme membrane anchor subunit [Flavobacteriaceae bacterium]|nr:NrfD/PsrC family molybdoenzyme membrane anchor subunit [Flavobacteriaceae bacterium]
MYQEKVHYSSYKPSKILLIILIAMTVVGVIATYQTLTKGHIILNSTQHIPWGIWVAAYLFAISFSIGAYLVSSLSYVFKIEVFKPIRHLSLVISLLGVVLAGFFIILDLGHPLRMMNIFLSFNPESPMAWMGILYGLFAVGLVLQIAVSMDFPFLKYFGERFNYIDRKENREKFLKTLGVIGVIVTLLVLIGEGGIFAVAKARPAWFGGLFPILLIISGIASGAGIITYFSGYIIKLTPELKTRLLKKVLKVSVTAMVVTYIMLFIEMSTKFYSGVAVEIYPWSQMLFGEYWYTFWIFQMLVGLIFPLYAVLKPSLKNPIRVYKWAGFAVALGLFCLRLNIVMPSQANETILGISEANTHWRFSLGYAPSLMEYFLILGGIALFLWLLLLAVKFLPLNNVTTTSNKN